MVNCALAERETELGIYINKEIGVSIIDAPSKAKNNDDNNYSDDNKQQSSTSSGTGNHCLGLCG